MLGTALVYNAVAELALVHVAPGIFLQQSCWKEKSPYGASLPLQKALGRDLGTAAPVQKGNIVSGGARASW